ncbi:MAG: thioredoxin-dependent thiol peroxidase [Planctomycetota bacterium]
MTLKAGDKAPAFKLPDQNGKIHDLKDYKGQWVLVYFYPKDDTPGCTKEACAIRDAWADYKKEKVQVFGVSADSPASHTKFITKFTLPFTLLADEDKVMVKAYDVWGKKKFMGREYEGIFRHSFLINPEGKIAKIYDEVKPDEHAAEVLADVRAFKKAAKT